MFDSRSTVSYIKNILQDAELRQELKNLYREVVREELREIYSEEVLDVPNAANFLGISETALRARVKRGQVRFQKIGRRITFRRSDLIRGP